MAVYDFSGAFRNLNDAISGVGNSFKESRDQETYAAIGDAMSKGDYATAQSLAMKAGKLDAGLKLAGMHQERADMDKFNSGLSGLLGGAGGNLNPSSGGVAIGNSGSGTQQASPSGGLGSLGTSYNPNGKQPAFAQAQPVGPSGGMDAMFSTHEQQFGLPSGYLSRTAQIESNGNPRAANPNSSARGLFQFINSTAKQYGLADPFDPAASTNAAARLAMDNANVLRRALNREPTAAELYLAHQQGAGGAAKLLANPNVRAADVVGEKAVRLNGGDPNMTAGQFASLWLNKFGGQQGGGQGRGQTQVAQTGPSAAERAKMAIERVDMLLNDPNSKMTPQQRQSLEARRQQYVQTAQSAPQAQGQPQADMPAAGAVPVQQAFQIPGTGEVVPAGTRLTPRAVNIMKMLAMKVPEHQKEPLRQLLKLELEAANPATQLANRKAQLDIQKAERDLEGEGATPLSPEEKQQFGIPAGQAAWFTRRGELKLGPAGTTINNDLRGEGAEAKAMGEAAGKRAGETMNAAFLGTKQLQRIGQIEALMQRVETGKMAPARMNLGAWGKAMGVNEDVLRGMGLDPTTVGDAQALNAIAGRMVIDMIGAGGFPANNFSDADRQFITGTVPQLANDPRGNKLIMEAARRTAQLDIQKAKEWRDWKKANKSGSFDDFEMLWADKVGSKNHFADLAEQANAITGGQAGPRQSGQPARIQSPQQYQALPRGATYLDPQGNVRTKQ